MIDLVSELVGTAEVIGHELSAVAAKIMLADLSEYPPEAVSGALRRCRREVKGKLALHDIIARIDDGRPSAESAWATFPRDEFQTAVVTAEQLAAYAVASPVIADGDMTGARIAFIAEYRRLVEAARADQIPIKWQVSLGADAGSRAEPIAAAVRDGKITADTAIHYLPERTNEVLRLAGVTSHPALIDESSNGSEKKDSGSKPKSMFKDKTFAEIKAICLAMTQKEI